MRRNIDSVPSRSELAQYQAQLLELYETVASKLMETRQYYATYNTVNDTYTFYSREVEILESITKNFPTAMKSKSRKAKLMDSLRDIAKQVNSNIGTVGDLPLYVSCVVLVVVVSGVPCVLLCCFVLLWFFWLFFFFFWCFHALCCCRIHSDELLISLNLVGMGCLFVCWLLFLGLLLFLLRLHIGRPKRNSTRKRSSTKPSRSPTRPWWTRNVPTSRPPVTSSWPVARTSSCRPVWSSWVHSSDAVHAATVIEHRWCALLLHGRLYRGGGGGASAAAACN
jgi:CCDC93 coiled-coil domain